MRYLNRNIPENFGETNTLPVATPLQNFLQGKKHALDTQTGRRKVRGQIKEDVIF